MINYIILFVNLVLIGMLIYNYFYFKKIKENLQLFSNNYLQINDLIVNFEETLHKAYHLINSLEGNYKNLQQNYESNHKKAQDTIDELNFLIDRSDSIYQKLSNIRLDEDMDLKNIR